jgi:hypothetical protein
VTSAGDDEPTLGVIAWRAARRGDPRTWLFFVGGLVLLVSGLAERARARAIVGIAMAGTAASIELISARTELLMERGRNSRRFNRTEILALAFVVLVIVGLLVAAVAQG